MSVLDLVIERPVAGGRMLARHDGVVVLVAGAIPGERVRARVERTTRHLIWAHAIEIVEPSPARRATDIDAACGGLDYVHIDYPEQLRMKSAVIVDTFRRIGKMSVDEPAVRPSPEYGYRLRARLQVRDGVAGFFREGTHELCDAASTGQLQPDATTAVQHLLLSLGPAARHVDHIIVAENVAASERVLHVEVRDGSPGLGMEWLSAESPTAVGTTGVTTGGRGNVRTLSGSGYVTDTATALFGDEAPVPPGTTWSRRPTSFFQGNRYLAGALARHVLEVTRADQVADLYAGVGLFAIAFAARGATVCAVEGDPSSAADLDDNAASVGGRIDVRHQSVEDAVPRLSSGGFGAVVVDPPRTGLSPRALESILDLGALQIVYVSCDPATLARDAARLVAGGYAIKSILAFDLFPNTSHVETVAAFERKPGG